MSTISSSQNGRRSSMAGSMHSGMSSSSMFSSQDALADALRIMQRRKEVAEEAKKKREERELKECSFKPAMTPRSEMLVERGARSDKPALHTPRSRSVDRSFEIEPLPRSPCLMNETSKIILAMSGGRTGPVHERLISFGEEAIAKHESERVERARREEALATHKPEICAKSEELVKKRSSGQTSMERLTQDYLQKKAEKQEKLRREADERLSASIEQIHHMNESSKRMLSQSNSRPPSIVDYALGRFQSNPTTPATTPRMRPMNGTTSPQPPKPVPSLFSPGQKPLPSPHAVSPRGISSKARSVPNTPRHTPMSPRTVPMTAMPKQANKDVSRRRSTVASSNIPAQEGTQSQHPSQNEGHKTYSIDLGMFKSIANDKAAKNEQSDAPDEVDKMRQSNKHEQFDALAEIDKMREEFRRVVEEKEMEALRKLDELAASHRSEDQALISQLSRENEQLQEERRKMSQRCEALEAEVVKLTAHTKEVEHERDTARRHCEKMKADLDSITEKGTAVVRLNAQLMSQVKELRAREHQAASDSVRIHASPAVSSYKSTSSNHHTIPAISPALSSSRHSVPEVRGMTNSDASSSRFSASDVRGMNNSDSDASLSTLGDESDEDMSPSPDRKHSTKR